MVDILGIGASGLTAYRKLLETVGENITNANTSGYVRRDVVLSVTGDNPMLPTSAASTGGSGVMVDMVRRADDTFLQMQALKANAQSMQSQTLTNSLSNLEQSIFSSSSTPGSVVQNFFNRFNDLANAPTSAAARTTVLDAGKEVSRLFAQSAGSVQDSITTARSGLDAALTEVNALTGQLASLNTQIQSAATSGQQPNDLLDQRDKLLSNLSDLTNISYTQKTSGAVTIYLGDTASGRPLVGPDGAHQLGVTDTGDKLNIVLDPYSSMMPTNQLTSGTIAGLMDFNTQAKSVLDNLNRLAVGFSVAVNQQHMSGVDLNGQPGQALFTTDGLKAVPSKTNLGDAKLMLSINNAASLSSATYTAIYSASKNTWSLKSSDGTTVSGTNNLSLDGVNFGVEGQAKDGDSFTVSPLLGAATSMQFLLQTPDQVAVASPLYVDPASANIGSALVTPVKRTDVDPPAAIPSVSNPVFNNQTTDFKSNGSALLVPAGTLSGTLTSLGGVSAINFTASAAGFAALDQPGPTTAASLTLSLNLDGDPVPPLTLSPTGSTLNDFANAINAAASQAGLSNAIYASVTKGALSINALGAHTVTQGHISGIDNNGLAATIDGVNEARQTPAQMQVFTREGRQLSGPPLTDAQAKALLTTANGFLPEATYVPPSATSGYPGISLTQSGSLINAENLVGGATVDVTAQAAFNAPISNNGQTTASGAVYAMSVDGLSPIRLAGDAIAGMNQTQIAAGLAQQMNSQASRVSWLSAPVNFANTNQASISFDVSIDGKDHQVVFHRAQDAKGNFLSTGTFDLGGATDLQVALVNGADGQTYNGTQITASLLPSSAVGQTVQFMNGSQLLGTRTLTAADVNLGSISIDQPAMSAADLSTLSATQTINGQSTPLANLTTATISNPVPSTASRVMITVPPSLRSTAPEISISPTNNSTSSDLAKLGFSSGQPFSANLTSANDLTSSLLQQRRPSLSITGSMIGDRVITINGPSGSSNGVSWNVVDGKLQLSSADASMQIDTSDPSKLAAANALGFTGFEPQGGKIGSTQNIEDGLLAAQAATITVAHPTGDTSTLLQTRQPVINVTGSQIGSQSITVNGPSGSSNGVSWAIVGGKLQLSSADATMQIDTSDPSKLASAVALGFTGSETPGQSIVATQAADVSLNTYTLTIGATSGSDAASGISWQTVGDKLTFSSGASAIQVRGEIVDNRNAAQSLGFNGSDLDLKIDNTVTSSDNLTNSLLGAKKPQLQVTGNQIGTQVLTIDKPSGTYNGVSWSMIGGKLTLSSLDPTMQVDTGTQLSLKLATALGFNGSEAPGRRVVASQSSTASLLASSGGVSLTVTSAAITNQSVNINTLAGSDATSGVSWSYDAASDRLVLSSSDIGFQVAVNSTQAGIAANSLGFRGQGADTTVIASRISLTSTAVDRASRLVDASTTVSRVGQSLQLPNGAPEDLIVAVNNSDASGLRRIAAAMSVSPTPKQQITPDLQIKILDNGQLEIDDPATGVSLANRSWQPNIPITYQGMSFTIKGDARAGDLYTIKYDNSRTSDNRNALLMSNLALTSIFGKGQGSFQDVYAGVAGSLGSAVQTSSTQAATAKQDASDLKSAYDAQTGVNLDQEASDLIRFQQAYQAAAQVVQAARDMFDRIVKL